MLKCYVNDTYYWKIGVDVYFTVVSSRRGNCLEKFSYAHRETVRVQGFTQSNPARKYVILKYLAVLPQSLISENLQSSWGGNMWNVK